jgi:hypothetical protein
MVRYVDLARLLAPSPARSLVRKGQFAGRYGSGYPVSLQIRLEFLDQVMDDGTERDVLAGAGGDG